VIDGNAFKIDWASKSKLRGPGDRSLGELLKKLRDRLASTASGMSITYVDDRGMRKLNREYRGINQITDVLSFPANPEMGEYPHLGDLVICLPAAEKMAEKLGISRRREVETLIIHGFLHLCGHDHETDSGEMLALQSQLERELLGEEPLPMHLKRGRKPGSKIKVLKDGTRVVVTGRAAKALSRRDATKKVAESGKPKNKNPKQSGAVVAVKRGPGRPRKTQQQVVTPKPVVKKVTRKKRATRPRSGVIA
jgi:probable rRNA maturation factor